MAGFVLDKNNGNFSHISYLKRRRFLRRRWGLPEEETTATEMQKPPHPSRI